MELSEVDSVAADGDGTYLLLVTGGLEGVASCLVREQLAADGFAVRLAALRVAADRLLVERRAPPSPAGRARPCRACSSATRAAASSRSRPTRRRAWSSLCAA